MSSPLLLGRLSDKRNRMKRFKETDKSKNEVQTVEKQGALDGSLSKSTSSVACLVCHGPFKMTSNSLIPYLPFCKECKSTYFTLMANQSRSENLLLSKQPKCPTGGQCIIDYRYSSLKEWCSSCHIQKFQAILRRFDTLKVNTGYDQTIEKLHPGPTAQGHLDLMNPVVLVEKLTSQDLAALGVEVPEVSRSDKPVIGESEHHVLLPSKSSSDTFRPHQSFPLAKQLKRHKKWASWRKKPRVTNPVMKSIDIYVFDCGHACNVCNSTQSKEWLKDCGFHTAPPSPTEAIHPTVRHCTNSLPLSAKDSQWSSNLNETTLSEQRPEMTIPQNPREPHTHSHSHTLHNRAAISQNSQAGGQPYQTLFPVPLHVSFAPQISNGVLLYGTVPVAVQSLKEGKETTSETRQLTLRVGTLMNQNDMTGD